MRNNLRLFAVWASVGLSACGGGGGGYGGDDGGDGGNGGNGGGGASAICQTVGGGSAQISATPDASCVGCAVAQAAAAIDGNLASAALIQTPTGGRVLLRGTAQGGVVFPAGRSAGVFVRRSGGDEDTALSIVIATYLDGVAQDRLTAFTRVNSTDTASGTQVMTDDGTYYGILTTQPYDAVELDITRSGDGPDYPVFELCTR